MWDNREKKTNPKAPDFKCKDKENCDGVIWPPRGRGNQQAVGRQATSSPSSPWRTGDSHSGAATTTRGNSGKEGYWERKEAADIAKQPRIERQHAQEMALRYAELKSLNTITTEALRDLTDWFQKDVGNIPSGDKPATPMPQTGSGEGPDFDDEIPF
jgi:hypothetical protein